MPWRLCEFKISQLSLRDLRPLVIGVLWNKCQVIYIFQGSTGFWFRVIMVWNIFLLQNSSTSEHIDLYIDLWNIFPISCATTTEPAWGVPAACFQVTCLAYGQQIFDHMCYAGHWLGGPHPPETLTECACHFPVSLLNSTQVPGGRNHAWFSWVVPVPATILCTYSTLRKDAWNKWANKRTAFFQISKL